MIHRIDRVNPDVDDRVIKPNEARMAVNLRFGASTDDTNLSGGTLVLGNKELTDFSAPAGENKVVGVYSDLETRNVFFAMYNSNGSHAIYRIKGTDNSIQAVVSGSWLNFQSGDAYNVSITGIDGKLYWTDNVNEPRMVNVEKGIRTQNGETGDVYPTTPIEDWFYTQIKRPPGRALIVEPMLEADLPGVSLTKQNKAITDTGFQYSYYYVYDNYEESRLAPYSKNTYGNNNITITIPADEFNTYATYTSLIKAIVIVIRNGNDGVWREIKYQKNDGLTRVFTFANILASQKNTVAADIVDARFDTVPLQSATNEVAQNKVNHANYRLDYEPIQGIEFKAIFEYKNDTPLFDSTDYEYKYKSFTPWGRYSIGVEFVDKFGRTQPVSNAVEVVAPWWRSNVQTADGIKYGYNIPLYNSNNAANITPSVIFDDPGNSIVKFSIKGSLPDWVDRINIVRSKCKNIVQMKQSLGTLYLWYKNQDGADEFFTWVNYGINPYINESPQNQWPMYEIYDGGNSSIKYTFQGYVLEFNANEPIVQGDNQYIYFASGYTTFPGFITPNEPTDNNVYLPYSRFKVNNVVGNKIYILASDGVETHSSTNQLINQTDTHNISPYTLPVACFNTNIGEWGMMSDINNYTQLVYNFVITQEVNADEQTLYTTQLSCSADEYKEAIQNNNGGLLTGYLYGDAYTCLALKTTRAFRNDIKIFNPGQISGQPVINSVTQRINALGWYGFFISMNPIDIWKEQWNQDIGQVNTTNYKDTESRVLNNAICFSGPIIQGTQVNGLNKFNSVDFRLAPAENGPITSLVTTNATQREPGVLLAIGTFGISSFYYDAIQLTNVDGSNNVATTDAYLASQRPLLGQYGTSRPMSVTKTPLGTVYWWSDVVNDMIRYTNSGLERLGNTFSFGNYLRKKYNDNPLLITWYDQVTDEVNLSGVNVNTAVFSERYKTFQGEREYFLFNPSTEVTLYPDRAIGLPTKQYWFIGGRIFVADVEDPTVPNNFLFEQYKNPSINVITNESPAVTKQWNQVKIYGPKPISTQLKTGVIDNSESALQLESYILPEWYISRKGDWDAAIRRAVDSSGGVLSGKLMESRILYSIFAFDPTVFTKLNFIEIKSNTAIVQ